MPSTRPATNPIAVIALILLGGAFATFVAIVGTVARFYQSPDLLEFRTSTTYFLLECFFAGLAVGVLLLFTRPRGPLAPIGAALAAFVAMEVGGRIGLYVSITMRLEHFPGTGPLGDLLKPAFGETQAYELLASLVAAGLALAKVLMSANSTTPRSAQPFNAGPPVPGAPFGAPGAPGTPGTQPAPGVPGPPAMGQPPAGQPMPAQPMPGQPMPPGQPGQPPAGPPIHGQPPQPPYSAG